MIIATFLQTSSIAGIIGVAWVWSVSFYAAYRRAASGVHTIPTIVLRAGGRRDNAWALFALPRDGENGQRGVYRLARGYACTREHRESSSR